MAECMPIDVFCVVGEFIGGATAKVADSVMSPFVAGVYQQGLETLKSMTTFWVDAPSADVTNSAVTALQQDLAWYTSFFALAGFLTGVIRLMVDFHRQGGVSNSVYNLAMPIWRIFVVSLIVGPGLTLAIKASDGLAKWLLERSVDGGDIDFTKMFVSGTVLLSNLGGAFFFFVILLLGAVVTWVFMLFRNVMFLVLAVFLPTVAAASGTEAGLQAYRKSIGWLVAMLLFKPVAAGIYALGFRLLVSSNGVKEGDTQAATTEMLVGVAVLGIAALALPALVKFVAPVAAGGGGFSGGAALAGAITVAGGAAALAATGGAAAPAVAAGSKAGTAAATAAPQAAGTAMGAPGGATPPGSPAPSPGGSPSGGGGPSGGSAAASPGSGGSSPGAGSPAASGPSGAPSAPSTGGGESSSSGPGSAPGSAGSQSAPVSSGAPAPSGGAASAPARPVPARGASTSPAPAGAPSGAPGTAPAPGAWQSQTDKRAADAQRSARINTATQGLAAGAHAAQRKAEDES